MLKRADFLKDIKSRTEQNWDVIIIGGGATGLGIAVDSTTRGYKTLLLEASDFAQGTSSRSTKLVHGGVRYLAKGDVFLVMEALHERGLLLKNAPHLIKNQQFIIPLYRFFDVLLYYIGLKFYDLLSGSLSMGKSVFLNKGKTQTLLPRIKEKGLKGGVLYHDGQFDDSRLAMTLFHTCVAKGGMALNYLEVITLLKNDQGKVSGVKVKEKLSGEEFILRSGLVINATGVFADSIAKMDNPSAKPTIKPSQGIHIIIDRSFLNSDSAIMIPETDDGRVLFAIPWHNAVVLGTTDTPINTISLEPVPLEKEIDFILKTASRYLTNPPVRKDVLSVFAGLRPLAANPDKPEATKEISRRHKINLSQSGLLSIIGGKWTTYRRMAEETLNKAIKSGILEKRKCITKDLKLVGYSTDNHEDRLIIYGHGVNEIKEMINLNPLLGEPLHPGFPYTQAELIWICKNEMPVSLEDILSRRTRCLLLNAALSLEIAPFVAKLMAGELGYDEKWQISQVEDYRKLVANYTVGV